jgi:hypothetical protein
MVFNTIFNNIAVISVAIRFIDGETEGPEKNHRPVNINKDENKSLISNQFSLKNDL